MQELGSRTSEMYIRNFVPTAVPRASGGTRKIRPCQNSARRHTQKGCSVDAFAGEVSFTADATLIENNLSAARANIVKFRRWVLDMLSLGFGWL